MSDGNAESTALGLEGAGTLGSSLFQVIGGGEQQNLLREEQLQERLATATKTKSIGRSSSKSSFITDCSSWSTW